MLELAVEMKPVALKVSNGLMISGWNSTFELLSKLSF
jgi:hypothetical protein